MDYESSGFLTGLTNSINQFIGNRAQSQSDQQGALQQQQINQQNYQQQSDTDLQQQERLLQFQKQLNAGDGDPNRPSTINTGNLKQLSGWENVEKMFGPNKDIAISDMPNVYKALNPNSGDANTKTIPAGFAKNYLMLKGVDEDTADAQAKAAVSHFGRNIPIYVLEPASKTTGNDIKPDVLMKGLMALHADSKGKPSLTKQVPGMIYGTNEVPMTPEEIQDGMEKMAETLESTGRKQITSLNNLDDITVKAHVAFLKEKAQGMNTVDATNAIVGSLKKTGKYSNLAISKIISNSLAIKANADEQVNQQEQQQAQQPQVQQPQSQPQSFQVPQHMIKRSAPTPFRKPKTVVPQQQGQQPNGLATNPLETAGQGQS